MVVVVVVVVVVALVGEALADACLELRFRDDDKDGKWRKHRDNVGVGLGSFFEVGDCSLEEEYGVDSESSEEEVWDRVGELGLEESFNRSFMLLVWKA